VSDRPTPDPAETFRRIVALLERTGLAREEVLRVEGEGGLSYASGLPAEDVHALLHGGNDATRVPRGPGTTDVEQRHRQVVDRILFLRRTRLKAGSDGSLRPYSLAEIAAGAGTSAQWLDKMIRAGKAPNLDHAAGIAGFFGEKIEFLVDPPAEALDRILQQIHKELLERTVERQEEDLVRLQQAGSAAAGDSGLGIVGYAARALADVPDDTAQPLIALIESVARRAREERAREK
jgi:transcriptional regulator with XRE-family HTH domain